MANRQLNNWTSSISVLAITISLVAGQSVTQKSLAQTSTTLPPAGVISINGAGASTVNPLLVGTGTTAPFAPQGSWFNVFGVGNPPTLNDPAGAVNGPVSELFTFRFASVGSGAGVRNFFCRTVPPASPGPTINLPISFGSTDDFLTPTDTNATVNATNPACVSLPTPSYVQVPVIGLGLALAYNRTGLTIPAAGLRLSRPTYCAILNGNITNWNDARIRNDNGGAIISANRPLRIVRRSDNSGSTLVVSSHLNTACRTTGTPGLPAASVWSRGVGSISTSGSVPPAPPADTVVWPPSSLGASGGGGVASAIVANAGAIGYVDSATRAARSLPAAILRNRAGNYTAISPTSISAALTGLTDSDPTFRRIRIVTTDPAGATAYPISTVSYLLFYDQYTGTNATNIASGIRGFINWALASPAVGSPTADAIATARGYAPLPASIKSQVQNVVNLCVDTVLDPATTCN